MMLGWHAQRQVQGILMPGLEGRAESLLADVESAYNNSVQEGVKPC